MDADRRQRRRERETAGEGEKKEVTRGERGKRERETVRYRHGNRWSCGWLLLWSAESAHTQNIARARCGKNKNKANIFRLSVIDFATTIFLFFYYF